MDRQGLACSSLVIAMLTLASCASLTPQQQAQLQADANQKIICSKGSDCDMKWGRALTWISQNSHWKIQIQNDLMIQTYTSMDGSPRSSFLVNKVPIDTETFEIQMASGCDNMFGCVPDATRLRAMFNVFVIGPAPAVSGVPSQQKSPP